MSPVLIDSLFMHSYKIELKGDQDTYRINIGMKCYDCQVLPPSASCGSCSTVYSPVCGTDGESSYSTYSFPTIHLPD